MGARSCSESSVGVEHARQTTFACFANVLILLSGVSPVDIVASIAAAKSLGLDIGSWRRRSCGDPASASHASSSFTTPATGGDRIEPVDAWSSAKTTDRLNIVDVQLGQLVVVLFHSKHFHTVHDPPHVDLQASIAVKASVSTSTSIAARPYIWL